MPATIINDHPVHSELVLDDGYGNVYQYSLGEWTPGQYFVVRPEATRRKRPSNLRDPGSLTAWGGHVWQRTGRSPVNITYPVGATGYAAYKNLNPLAYAPCGFEQPQPQTDPWQTALRLAVKDQKVNVAQSVGEYRQTQDMFVKVARDVVKVFRGLRSGDMSSVFRTLNLSPRKIRGTIADRWLELQYGWKPLLQDLHGAVEELKVGLQRPRYRVIHKTLKAQSDVSRDCGVMPDGSHATLTESWTVSTRIKAYLKMDSHLETRIGITNPMALAWELLPYSFVIDWLIPIGDWLNSLDAGIGLIEVYGTVTTTSKHEATQSYGGQYIVRKEYARDVFIGLPSAPLPTWNPSIGYGRVLNAIGLLSQMKR